MRDKTAIVALLVILVLVLILWFMVFQRPTLKQKISNKIDRDMNRAADFFRR